MSDLPTLKFGSSVTILDPCYIPQSRHMEIEINVRPGEWIPYVEMADEGSWGLRVSKLGITRDNWHIGTPRVIGHAGVDSGQMMIIDTEAIGNWENNDDEPWPYGTGAEPEDTDKFDGTLSYYGACKLTLGPEQAGVLDELAVVSSSGLGDGSYPVYIFEQDGQIERVEVNFLLEADDEDAWEDDWDEEFSDDPNEPDYWNQDGE